MKKWLPLVIVSLSCFALGSCKDVRLGASGVDAGGGSGGGAGNTGGVIGTGGTGGTDTTDGANDAAPALQGVFVPTGSMAVGREYHTATLLPNGKVLIAGGWVHSALDDTADVASAELYDPGTGTFTATGSLNAARQGHTATLLANGRVLITGGFHYQEWLASAELYDPRTGIFTATGSLNVARAGHTATLLANGLVLIAGGYNGAIPATPQPIDPDAGFFYTGTFPATAELYDPGTGTFTATGSLNAARDGHTATLLPNGLVLIAGGNDGSSYLQSLASAELYDLGAGTFTATASMVAPRAGHTATLLSNGTVLIAGGDNGEPENAELFDPRVGTFASTGGIAESRSNHTATLLSNGTVLVAGGAGSVGDLASAELYDPDAARFVATGSMTGTRTLHTATLLQNGTVLLAGGSYGGGGWSASAELYQ